MFAETLITACLCLMGADEGKPEEVSIDQAQVRAAIQRSLPLVERQGVEWIEDKKCVSCHRVSFMTWSMTEAAKHELAVNRAALDESIDWALSQSLSKREQDGVVVGSTNLDGLSQLILGRGEPTINGDRAQAYAACVQLILEGQKGDGSWMPGGQLPAQKRPANETAQVTTMWNALALASMNEADEAIDEACEKAVRWVRQAETAKSTEWFVARYLVEREFGGVGQARPFLQAIVSQQNPDGGWGWLCGGDSDALATGQVLYALGLAGETDARPVVRRALQFLVTTQRGDGSWPVFGTKAKKQKQIEETSVYWGTTWAVIGLSTTLGR